jgi:hypothetical protein
MANLEPVEQPYQLIRRRKLAREGMSSLAGEQAEHRERCEL